VVETSGERINRYRATAHFFALTAVGELSVENGECEVTGDSEVAICAASLATMYFASALDAEHFGDLPKPEVKLHVPGPGTVGEKYGLTGADERADDSPADDFETWCNMMRGLSSRARRKAEQVLAWLAEPPRRR
jgi:hypothetical protein